MKVKELRKLIEADGWILARQSGSHMQFKHPIKTGLVTLAGHKPSDDVAIGTAISILKQAGLRYSIMRKYLVIFEHTATGYSAYVPDLPGLAAFGETRAEAEQNAREGIAFHIEGLVLEGLPIPEPNTESATLEVAVA